MLVLALMLTANPVSHFTPAVEVVLEHEGGYVNDPDDPGGPTKFGLSLRQLLEDGEISRWDHDRDGDLDAEDIKNISESQAVTYYYERYWDPQPYKLLDQSLATKMLDLSVHLGSGRANKLLQRALRANGQPIDVDGLLGPQTLAAVTKVDTPILLLSLKSSQIRFYRSLVEAHPRLAKFERGWLARANS